MSAQQLITEHIDLWTSTIKAKNTQGRGSSKKRELYGIKKLRELILELAVRGKLVPQDPSDEPASELLKRIAAEKTRLIKDKKIKKQKPLPEITDEEKLFDLPSGWKWVRLGNIGNIYNGNSVNARVKEEKYTDVEGLPFIATKDVGYGFEPIDYSNGVCIPIGEPKFKVAYKGAVLVCAEGGSAGKKCGVANKDICFGNKLFANQLFGEISPAYVLSNYLTPTFYKQFSESMTGIIGGISTSKFFELIMPLPPLNEQHRIVAKVDELMALCDQLEQQTESSLDAHNLLVDTLLSTLTDARDAKELSDNWARLADHFDTLITTDYAVEQLKQTILQLAVMGKLVPQDPSDEPASELLKRIAAEKEQLIKDNKIKKQKPLPEITDEERPFDIPKSWEWCRLDGPSLHSEAGWSPKCHGAAREDDKWGVLKVSAVTWGQFNPEENKELPDYLEPRPEFEVKENDFLISRANTAELVAKSVVVPIGVPTKLMMSDKIIRFVFSESIKPAYFSLVNNSQWSRDYYAAVAGGTSSSMKNVSRKQIQMLVVAMPSLSEQARIMDKVDKLMVLCDKLKARLNVAQFTQLHLANSLVERTLIENI
jgi:type I restriction enzyme S subunit